MKLVSFLGPEGRSYGVETAEGVIDARKRNVQAADLRVALSDLSFMHALAGSDPDYSTREITYLPPIQDAKRIICVGLNYRSHIAETGRDAPAYPILFARFADSLVGHGEAMVRPKASEHFDFEGELAFVIGRGGRHIKEEQALGHVAGFMAFNDGSVRDYQRHTSQFLPGKTFHRSGAVGPWLVTPDEAGPVEAMELTTRLNGVVMQSAAISDLLFGVEQLIAYASRIWPLEPGDVFATGTTGGVGAFRNPPVWMQPGDVVEVEISNLGVLRNPIVAEQ